MDTQHGNGWFDKVENKLILTPSNNKKLTRQMNIFCDDQVNKLKREAEKLKEITNPCRQVYIKFQVPQKTLSIPQKTTVLPKQVVVAQEMLVTPTISRQIPIQNPTPNVSSTSSKSQEINQSSQESHGHMTSSNLTIKGKSIFIFDFDCTLTYSHWFYFIRDFNGWKSKFLEELPYYYGCPEDAEEKRNNTLQILSQKISQFITTNNNLNKEQYISKAKSFLSKEELQLLLHYIMGGKARLLMICSLIETLIKNGYEIAIASRGFYNDILFLLAILDSTNNIKMINANHDCTYDANQILRNSKYISKEAFIKSLLDSGYKKVRYIDDDPTEHKNLLHEVENKDYKYYGPQTEIKNTKNSQGISFRTNGKGLRQIDIDAILKDNGITDVYKCTKTKFIPNNKKKVKHTNHFAKVDQQNKQ